MNRKIFIRRADIDALFRFHVPYQVRRVIAKPKEDYYSVEEIKEKYKVSKDTIFKYASSRNIPRVKHGNKTYFSKNIIVLNHGKVTEVGNHESLTAKRGAYYKLVKNQLELGN